MGEKYNGSQRKTWYGNHLYDSKEEAKWAAFLDGVGIKFVPHPVTFKTNRSFGGWAIEYSPDFYLCEYNLYCEVKPKDWALNNEEVQRKISAAMDNNFTPVGHGLLIFGGLSGFCKNESKRLFLQGEFYEWFGADIIKRRWSLGRLKDGSVGFDFIDPDWDSDSIFSKYPKFSQDPKAIVYRSYESENASETIYKALFNAVMGDNNGLYIYEDEVAKQQPATRNNNTEVPWD